jgi:hypothetical protein
MLTTAPIAMYIVGMIREMNTENERRTVKAFLTNTAFNCNAKFEWGSYLGSYSFSISGKGPFFKIESGSKPILTKMSSKELIVNEN